MSYIVQKKKRNRQLGRLIPCFIWLLAVWGGLDHAVAQNRNNQSDWNVPPPLTPGTITKGNTRGNSSAGKPIVLTLTDIPVVAQPFVSSTQMPVLAAIGSTPPVVDAPGQPEINGATAGLPEIPSPEAPETPQLPKQTMQDLQFSSVIDLPLPESPELPPSPVEPTVSGQVNIIKGPIPVMPDITGTVPLLQPSGNLIPWSIPEIPESESFKMTSPAGTKDDKLKGKPQSNRKKQ
ncbi:hypothetical protein SNE26_05080 [Mucilaginibacter sp. cycad4]|uniref:hypothetical protein n=1 Tax=Mucilaginibacter sp. cycad4 TaxID=3342096 RepID=UPI002AABA1BF|nr:hypothetical protein [Mucilaginibacter gossypii]WPV01138.1 hypothetical protein SNE26_05080 [Mucilaginibacter gossypii]